MSRDFNTCTEITWFEGRRVRTERVVARIRPQFGLRALRTASGAVVPWNDVIMYKLPKGPDFFLDNG